MISGEELQKIESILKFAAERGFSRHKSKRIIRWQSGERILELSFPEDTMDDMVIVTLEIPIKLAVFEIIDGKLRVADAVMKAMAEHPVIG